MRTIFLQIFIRNTPQTTGVYNLYLMGKNTNLHFMRVRIGVEASMNQGISDNLTQSNRRNFFSINEMSIFQLTYGPAQIPFKPHKSFLEHKRNRSICLKLIKVTHFAFGIDHHTGNLE